MGNYEDAEQLLSKLREWEINDAHTVGVMAQAYAALAIVDALRSGSLDSSSVQATLEESPQRVWGGGKEGLKPL